MGNMIPIKSSEFCEDDLNRGNVWTWQNSLLESEDSLVPVQLTEEALMEAGLLLIRAMFITRSGKALNGLVVYQIGDGTVFAIEVLSGHQRFTLNKWLPDLSAAELERLGSFLNEDVEALVPIRYSIAPRELDIDDGEFSFGR